MSVCRTKLSVKYAKYSPSFLADSLDVSRPTKIVRKVTPKYILDLVNYFKRMIINPRRACAQRGLLLCSCPVCVCVYVCLFVVFCHHAHLDPEIIIGTIVFTAAREKLL